jgi:nitrogenase-stabilizing/protective protein
MTMLPSGAEGLVTIEEFLEFFALPFDADVIGRSRLHILQRFHDYLAKDSNPPTGDEERFRRCQSHLAQAYQDFVASTPIDERVFKVLREAVDRPQQPPATFVPVDVVIGARRPKP